MLHPTATKATALNATCRAAARKRSRAAATSKSYDVADDSGGPLMGTKKELIIMVSHGIILVGLVVNNQLFT